MWCYRYCTIYTHWRVTPTSKPLEYLRYTELGYSGESCKAVKLRSYRNNRSNERYGHMELNMNMLGRILHAIANEIQAMDNEQTTVSEPTDMTPVQEDMSRFQSIETVEPIMTVAQQQEPLAQPVEQVLAQAPVCEQQEAQQLTAEARIAQLEEQLSIPTTPKPPSE